MARVRFVPNPGFTQEALHSTLLVADLQAAAQDIAEHAKALAPVETGEYKNSIEAHVEMGPGGIRGIAIANAPYSGFIEFGTSDTPAFAPLRRGAQGASYRLRA